MMDPWKRIDVLTKVIIQLQIERDHFEAMAQDAQDDAQAARNELAEYIIATDKERRKWTHMGK